MQAAEYTVNVAEHYDFAEQKQVTKQVTKRVTKQVTNRPCKVILVLTGPQQDSAQQVHLLSLNFFLEAP